MSAATTPASRHGAEGPGLPAIAPDAAAADFTPEWRRGVNAAHFLSQTARRLPDSPAVIDPGSAIEWSWSELDDRAHALAAELRDAGVRRRDTVMLLSTNHAEMIQAFWAIFRVGAVAAPPNAKLSSAEIAALARNTMPKAIVAHRELAPVVADLRAEGLVGTVYWIGGAPEPMDAAGREGSPSAPAGTVVADLPAASSEQRYDDTVSEDDPCWYFFTSGSTGTPKAPAFTHRHLGAVLMNHYCDLFPGADHTGASLVVAPLSHGAGIHMLAQVFPGCPSVLYSGSPFRGEEAWELIDRYEVTNAFTVPTILNRIVAGYPTDRGPSDHSLRTVVYAGAPMLAADQEHAIERLGACLVQYFGLGEVTGAITALRPEEHGRVPVDDAGIGTCGRARTAVQISIQDDDGRELPAGDQGEVCVAGPTVCAGYLNNPEANAEAFAGGWFHTGDIGYLDAAGYLFLTGRKSDMYISGGSNVYPREIEELLLTHGSVSQVAVVGVPDRTWGEVGVALVEPAPDALGGLPAPTAADDLVGADAPDLAAELKEFLTGGLAAYKVPKRFRFVASMSVTAYGKIARKEIRAALTDRIAAEEADA